MHQLKANFNHNEYWFVIDCEMQRYGAADLQLSFFPSELSAAGAKRGLRSLPMRSVPSRRSIQDNQEVQSVQRINQGGNQVEALQLQFILGQLMKCCFCGNHSWIIRNARRINQVGNWVAANARLYNRLPQLIICSCIVGCHLETRFKTAADKK